MDFRDIKDKRYKIESIKERIERLRSSMEIGARAIGSASGTNNDRMADKMARLMELEERLLDETAEIENIIRQAEYEIDALPDHQRRIVRLRDIDCMSWGRIARKTHYNKRHCLRIHAAAIKNLQKIEQNT